MTVMATLVMPRAEATSSGVYATGVRPLLLLASDGSAAAAAATRVTIALAAASGAFANGNFRECWTNTSRL